MQARKGYYYGKVIADMSMSIDGFITGPNDTIDLPLGEGGEWLHDWVFEGADEHAGTSPRNSASGINRNVLAASFESTGAIVMGRRWFDIGEGPWGDDPPFGVPIFILTHDARETVTKGATTYIFVTDGLASAMSQAKAAAGAKNIGVGGANTIQQCLRAGLLDEVQIHLVPLRLGAGKRLFDPFDGEQYEIQSTAVLEGPGVTHLRFRVVK